MITANSFMKREFGKKLIEEFFPRVDLTHVIHTSGAYIPGHGTPTVILFGRDRPPVGQKCVRCLAFEANRAHQRIRRKARYGGRLSSYWIRVVHRMSLSASPMCHGKHSPSIHGVSGVEEQLNSKSY